MLFLHKMKAHLWPESNGGRRPFQLWVHWSSFCASVVHILREIYNNKKSQFQVAPGAPEGLGLQYGLGPKSLKCLPFVCLSLLNHNKRCYDGGIAVLSGHWEAPTLSAHLLSSPFSFLHLKNRSYVEILPTSFLGSPRVPGTHLKGMSQRKPPGLFFVDLLESCGWAGLVSAFLTIFIWSFIGVRMLPLQACWIYN